MNKPLARMTKKKTHKPKVHSLIQNPLSRMKYKNVDITADLTETKRITREVYEQLYANKSDNLD